MVSLMSYTHDVVYGRRTTFTVLELAAITPHDIRLWMNWRAFGVPNPGPAASTREGVRRNTLEFMKKAVSWYMPNTGPWDCIRGSGNPTRSKDVNDVIKAVKKLEVRREGAPPQTKRPMTQEEFRALLAFFCKKMDFQHRYRYSTMILYQYHLIARCDDLANFRVRDLRSHSDPRFSGFALETRVHWSKNVLEERDCPEQIFLASYDPEYCLFLALSVYLETWFSSGTTTPATTVLLFGDGDGERAVDRIKANFSTALRTYFTSELMIGADGDVARSDLGTHSLRKYASTFAHNNGCSFDEIDCRGRWKRNSGRTVDRYIDVRQAFIDAKVQGVLCVGGPIRYSLVADCGLSRVWCDENVVPGLRRFFGHSSTVPDLLALPLLFACMDDELSLTVPLTLVNRVRTAYEAIRTLDMHKNPVKRIHLHIQRVDDRLAIFDVAPILDAVGNEIAMVSPNTQQEGGFLIQQNIDNQNAIMIQMQQIRQQGAVQYDALSGAINNLRIEMNEKNTITNRNISRISIQPSRMATPQQEANNNTFNINDTATLNVQRTEKIAQLMKTPRTLFDLWIEYQVGTGERKAAKDFTYRERGRVRTNYCRRKVVWDCISNHVRAGFGAMTAIDKIYESYGRGETVTSIIKQMTRDKKTGGHPNLRV